MTAPGSARLSLPGVPASAIRYALVGSVNTLFGYTVIYGAMYFLALSPAGSNALGYGAGLLLSFALNRRFTFRSRRRVGAALPRFALVTAAAYLVNLTVVMALTSALGVDPYPAQAAGLLPYLVIGYLGNRFFVFADAEVIS